MLPHKQESEKEKIFCFVLLLFFWLTISQVKPSQGASVGFSDAVNGKTVLLCH